MSENDESRKLQFHALTDLCTDINEMFNNSIFTNKSRMKEEKAKQEIKISKNITFSKEKIQMNKMKQAF